MMADCRRWPSDSYCSLTIIGEEDAPERSWFRGAVAARDHALVVLLQG
jgi:hypothetical protein